MQIDQPIIVWFRRDLRLRDNPALLYAISTKREIVPLYILEDLGEASQLWLHQSLLNFPFKLVIRQEPVLKVLREVFKETNASEVVFNHVYEPLSQDKEVLKEFPSRAFHGNVLFPPGSITTNDGKPFKIFTPFWRACLKEHIEKPLPLARDIPLFSKKIPSLKLEKQSPFSFWEPGEESALKNLKSFVKKRAKNYQKDRDFPSIPGGSFLSAHLHFGEISPREVWQIAHGHEAFLRQIVWREFAIHLLDAFPHITEEPFNPRFKNFPWKKNAKFLKAWKEGLTGYPIVDAGMRQLLQTGWMHNRVRMIVGSFLIKDLNISWKEGAAWFWQKLIDADLANNTFGWQWVAGCGTDAAPYFRVFNPTLQGEKFDPEGEYVKTFVPELKALDKKWIHRPWEAPEGVLGTGYPAPIVDHAQARKEALKRYHG